MKSVNLRVILIALAILNVLFFGYQVFAPDAREAAGTRIEELQINPGRIRLVGSATRGPGGHAANGNSSRAPYRACLEWGPFSAGEAGKAESALSALRLPLPAVQRAASEATSGRKLAYYVREPDAPVVAQVTELQRNFPGTRIKAGPCPAT